MKVTKCENRFEVIVDKLDAEERDKLIDEFVSWAYNKWLPTDEDYLAALGPCGK